MTDSTAIEKAHAGAPLRPPTGLLLSIGDTTTSRGGKEIPTKIDHFRPKPGQLEQYAAAAAKFAEVYGPEPKELTDIYFLSNDVRDVLDIKLVAFGTSGIRGVGLTNYADLPADEFQERAWAFDDTFRFFPRELSEVRRDLRETWEGEPIEDTLKGPDDPRVDKLGIRLTATLSFCLPPVMGIGKVAQITTGGRRSIRNLYSSVWSQFEFFRGRLAGPPFRLEVRPARTQRFVKNETVNGKKFTGYVPVDFYELVLDTSLTVQEIYDRLRERNEALGGADQRALTSALALPPAGEEQEIREEPALSVSDAILNRIAHLEEQAGPEARVFLHGVFGADSAADLHPDDAERYAAGLERVVAESEDLTDAEVELRDPDAEAEAEGIEF